MGNIDKLVGEEAPLEVGQKINELVEEFNHFNSLPIGTIIPVNASSSYVPDGTLPCDGAEYTREQFKDFCKNYLDGEYSQFLATCSYAKFEEEVATYGQCSKFAVEGNTTITADKRYTTADIQVSHKILQAYPNGVELEFTYDGTNWLLDGKAVALSDYYITATGTPTAGDHFAVTAALIKTFRVPLSKDTETVVTNNIDYANGIKITTCPLVATPFVAPFDGVFIFTFYENINKFAYCYINGVLSPHQFNDGDATNVSNTYNIPLSKGDSIYWDIDVTIRDGAFFPYKEEEKEKLKSFVVVANGQTNQSLMDWSQWASSLQGKMNADHSNDTKPYIVETSDKSLLPSWYRVWSDGWCEQGGIATGGTNTSGNTITLLKSYVNNQYNLLASVCITDKTTLTNSKSLGVACVNKTTSSFNASTMYGDGTFQAYTFSWQAKGYIK